MNNRDQQDQAFEDEILRANITMTVREVHIAQAFWQAALRSAEESRGPPNPDYWTLGFDYSL